MPISQLFIGLFTEGTTDIRFFKSIVKRTFDEISFECSSQIEIYDIQIINKTVGLDFNGSVIEASRKGINEFGITILCVHVDSDNDSDQNVFRDKINPALEAIENSVDDICKVIVPVVPVQMTESWMLADKALFKKEIGTNKSDQELDIYKDPESYSDPKTTIENAIRIALQERTRRHRKELTIADLYLSMGQSISIEKLKKIPSYIKFQENVRNAFKKLNYLH
jgi:hypothetical protein